MQSICSKSPQSPQHPPSRHCPATLGLPVCPTLQKQIHPDEITLAWFSTAWSQQHVQIGPFERHCGPGVVFALHAHLGNNLSEENKNIKLSLCAQSKVQTSVEHEGGTAPFQLQKNCEARSAMTACDQRLYYFASIILPFLHDLFVATPWIHGTETHGCGAAECTGYTLVRSDLILHIRVHSALNLGTRHKLCNRSLWPKTCFFLPEPNSERN